MYIYIFGSGKPRGVGILGGRVYELGEGMKKLVYEQPGNEEEGSCHSKEGSKYSKWKRGEKGSKGEQRKICLVHNVPRSCI
jgi:hypothetical protein